MTRLAELRALLAKATPGPFYDDDAISGDGYVVMADGLRMAHFHETPTSQRYFDQSTNAALVAAVLNALPALLDVAEAAAEVAGCWGSADGATPGQVALNKALRKLLAGTNVIGDEK